MPILSSGSPKSPSLAARHDALEPDAFDAYDALGAYANKGPVPALPPSSMQRSATTSKHSSSFPVRRESPRVMWSEDVEEPPSAVRERERERARSASPRMERGGYSPRWRSPNRLERPEVHDVVVREPRGQTLGALCRSWGVGGDPAGRGPSFWRGFGSR